MKLSPMAGSVLTIAVLYLVAWSVTLALKWRGEPMIEAMGINAQGFVWVETVLFNNQRGGSTGNAGGGWCRGGYYVRPQKLGPPSYGGLASNSPMPVPKRALFQWFNFSQQRYYEAVIDDPSMPHKAMDFARSLRDWRRFEFSLIYDFSENGSVRLWLYGTDFNASHLSKREDKWVYALLGTAQGYEIEGDPNIFKETSEKARRECRIPRQPDPAPAATQPKRESVKRHWPDQE